MKVINKFLCFLSVLVLFVPLLCFNVSADDTSELSLEEYYLTGGTGDFSDIVIRDSDSESNFSTEFPYVSIVSDDKHIYDYSLDIPSSRFKFGLSIFYKYAKDVDLSDFYYVFRYGTFTYNDNVYYNFNVYYSLTPLSIVDGYIISDSTIWLGFFQTSVINGFTQLNYPLSPWSQVLLTNKFSKTISNGYPDAGTSNYITDYNVDYTDFYSNCITEYNGNKVSARPKSSALKDNIEVKLTPDFGLDMDRIDPLTNQSDYFKFEIKNNSDSPVQWCAGIYDPQLITADTVYIDSISSWGYVSRTTYYDFSCQEEKGIFRTTYTYSGTLKTGSFNYHYLEPGETFTDVIYWENIKISPNVIYHFFVNAVKTDLNHATLNIDPPVMEESSDMHSVTKIEDSYYNTILNVGSAFRTLESNIYNVEFSCLSMPAFTTTVRSGNSVLNTSGTDRYKQYENYETVSDINGLDTKVNKDYVDPSILANLNNKSDVNVDFDNVGLDDVKNYISYSQDFFNLIKSVLGTFPAFVWVLICFGLTGLIVIAIIKALL